MQPAAYAYVIWFSHSSHPPSSAAQVLDVHLKSHLTVNAHVDKNDEGVNVSTASVVPTEKIAVL